MADEIKGAVNIDTGAEVVDLNANGILDLTSVAVGHVSTMNQDVATGDNVQFPTVTTSGVKAINVGGLSLQNNSGSPILYLGGGGGVNATFNGNTLFAYNNASRLTWLDGSKVLRDTDLVDWVAGTEDEIDVTDDGDGSITLSLAPTYAEICVADATTAQSIPLGTTYTKLTAFTINGLSSNCTADVANDKITITKTGTYRVACAMSGQCGTVNTVFRIAGFLNGVEQDCAHFKRKFAVANDSGSMSFTGLLNVTSVPLDLDVRARHDNAVSAVNLTIEYSDLNVERIGPAI